MWFGEETVSRRMLRDKEEGFYCSPDGSVMVMLRQGEFGCPCPPNDTVQKKSDRVSYPLTFALTCVCTCT